MADQEYQDTDYATDQQTPADSGRSQSSFDTDFSTMIAAGVGQPDAVREAWQAYFDLAEQTLRSARRVSEVQTLSLMRQQIVTDVTRQVVATIRQNPQLIQDLQS